MKKVSKILAIVLCLAMILTVAALADWTEFGGGSAHNGRITDAAPHITSNPAPSINPVKLNPSGATGWDGVDSIPVMRTATVDNSTVTYAYVLYNSRTNGAHLLKYDCTNEEKVWDKQINGSGTFQLSTPLLIEGQATDGSEDVIYLAASNALKYNDVELNDEHSEIEANVTFTESFSSLYLPTSSNRVAVGIYLGHTNVADRGTITTTGTASITLGNASTGTLTLNKTNTASYKMFEEPVYQGGDLTGYNYYYYINHNLNDSVGTGKTLTINVTLDQNADVEYIDMYGSTSAVQKVTNLNATTPSNNTIVDQNNNEISIQGQINTPITGNSNYIYFGTYTGMAGGKYYQYGTGNKSLTVWDPDNGDDYDGCDFYWAGAYVDSSHVVFGSDNGYLCSTGVGSNFGVSSVSDVYLLNGLGNISDAGNVRSTICYYDGYLYFTSQGGGNTSYIWKVNYSNISNLSTNDVSKRQLSGYSSTSTPVISSMGYIYVGTYGNYDTFTGNGVRAIPLNNFTGGAMKEIASGVGDGTDTDNDHRFPVQSSVIVYTDTSNNTTTDYVFFTVNDDKDGAGYCYSFDGTDAEPVWDTTSDENSYFALQGMAACDGYLVFGNDKDILYVIH